MAVGLGAFTEGLRGGIEARDRMDLNRELKTHLGMRNAEAQLGAEGRRKGALEMYTAGGGSEEDFNQLWSQYTQPRDPALLRFGKWIGGKMGFGGQPMVNEEQGALAAPVRGRSDGGIVSRDDLSIPQRKSHYRQGAVQYTDDAHVGGQPHYAQGYADGGQVYDEKGWRQDEYGRMVHESNDPANFEYGDNASSRAAIRTERLGRSAVEDFKSAETPAQYGQAVRDIVRTPIQGALDITQGTLRDVARGPTEFIGGMFGFGLDDEVEAPAVTPIPDTATGPTSEEKGVPTPEEARGGVQAATNATAPDPVTSDEQVAETALSEGEQLALENFDWQRGAAQGMRPADLPQMSTQEWGDYRREMVLALNMQGLSPSEALKEVDDITVGHQMRGFQREAQKAFNLLQIGDDKAAILALTMAYQYFPNGASVEFARYDDPKTGRPALVARAFDEETGEPTGSPQVVTAERINTMVSNMSNPDAFRAWTKDGRDLQMEIAKLESADAFRKGSLEVDAANATARQTEAQAELARARGGAGGGMTASEELARNKFYAEQFEKRGFAGTVDEEVIDQLSSLAAQVDTATNLQPNEITDGLIAAWSGRDGGPSGEAGLIEYLERFKQE